MDDVAEVVMKMGTEPAMKMNGMMMNMIRGQLSKNSAFSAFKDACKETTLVGKEKVDGEVARLRLVATGNGARSSIAEAPQEMPGLGGPPKQ